MPSRAVVLAVSFLAFILLAAAACTDDDGGGTSASEETATEGKQANSETEAVSEPCRAAMTAYHDDLVTSENHEGPLEVATLKACKSRGEWLAAVQPYADEGQGCPIACIEPETVYRAICGGNEDLPACRE